MTYKITTDKTLHQTMSDIGDTFRLWGVPESQWDVELKIPKGTKKYQTLEERRVTIKFTLHGTEITLVMDKQDRAVDNLRVLYLALEAMRLNEKRGLSDVVQEAYLQLAGPKEEDPYTILGVQKVWGMATIENMYRMAAKKYHPDNKETGNTEMFLKIKNAFEQIKKDFYE